ncbi:MAG: N-6 DNA methylase [Nitrososphaerota archaeon]
MKNAFLQYSRHKDESKIEYGIILFLPEAVRKFPPDQSIIAKKIRVVDCEALIDTPYVKRQIGRSNFLTILDIVTRDIIPKIGQREVTGYPLNTVIKILQSHVEEMMSKISLTDEQIVKIITDKKLLSNVGHTDPNSATEIVRFLSAYILLSQTLFLRLYSQYRRDLLPPREGLDTISWLRQAFRKVRDINYRPIYDIDVLGTVSEEYARDTLDLLWGLAIERIRAELPGRIFHELMPQKIRKLLAAFYTRPQAADLLAKLTITDSSQSVFDPACGSGTILVSAYKRKLSLYHEEGKVGNPHQKFCQEDIYGSDIMPFAVHLTGANLSSMDPSVTLNYHQIIQADSLNLSDSTLHPSGVQVTLMPSEKRSYDREGAKLEIKLEKVDCVLMNPPFTKVERGIRQYVNMDKYGSLVGYEVGLWGHFLNLAYDFLKEGGTMGAVIPVNVLRGRESEKVRKLLFEKMTPLYIVKSSLNYGFSEYAEYRDVLFIAKKGAPPPNHKVKYVLIKEDIKNIDDTIATYISEQVLSQDEFLSEKLDIQSIEVADLKKRFGNLMWYFSCNDLSRRKHIESFANKLESILDKPDKDIVREGYRPVPASVSSFMFLTREIDEARTEMAFLRFKKESNTKVDAYTNMGIHLPIEKSSLLPSLRTGVGLRKMNVSNSLDYVANKPYVHLDEVKKAAGIKSRRGVSTNSFWKNVNQELKRVSTKIVILRRIGLSSPNQHLISFYSEVPFSPSNTLNVITETDEAKAKALTVLFNSIVFLSQFFLLKEESASRWADIRFYDIAEMNIIPKDENTYRKLTEIFDRYANVEFPSIAEQMDRNFYKRYDFFWESMRKRGIQETLEQDVKKCMPAELRIKYDLEVCNSIGLNVTEEELLQIYCDIADDLIVSRGLKRE